MSGKGGTHHVSISRLASALIDVTSTGVKTVTTPHLLVTPPELADVSAILQQIAALDTGFRFNSILVASVDATNIVVKFNVSVASAGGTCRLGIIIAQAQPVGG